MNASLLSERTRLQLDGVGATITAERAWACGDTTLVRQALPFLRLDTEVTDEDGRRARIRAVTISMDGDVPRLELELREVDEADLDTLVGFELGVSRLPARTDSTVPYEYGADRPLEEVVVRDPAPGADEDDAPELTIVHEEPPPAAAPNRVIRTSRLPAVRMPEPSLLARLLRSFTRAWRALVRHPAFALLRG